MADRRRGALVAPGELEEVVTPKSEQNRERLIQTMTFQHDSLARGRWLVLSLAEQLGNIGSEVHRARLAQKVNESRFIAARDRALELFDLTLADVRWRGRIRELARAREVFATPLLAGRSITAPLKIWSRISITSRLPRENEEYPRIGNVAELSTTHLLRGAFEHALAESFASDKVHVVMNRIKSFVSLENVLIRLHEKVLFEGLNWEILADQHWAIIGPNGSGKSALLRALAGSLPVAKGNITHHFLGNKNRDSAQDQIAFVAFGPEKRALSDEVFYQERWNVGLNEDAPSVSNLLSAQGIRHTNPFVVAKEKRDAGFPARRQKVIQQLGLKSLLARKLFQLSNGERRKLGIARALLQNPKLLILDNPFEGLDEGFRTRLRRNLESLMRGKMRIVIAGTSRDEIPSGITNVLRIKSDGTISQGRLQEMGRLGIGTREKLPTGTKNRGGAKKSRILVEMKNVNVSYDKTPVLRGINWTVRENEKWALLGQNGAGKTTLLSLIIGDNPQAYANNITIFGKRRGTGESIWEIKKKIGWVAPELQIYYPIGASCLDVVSSGFFRLDWSV